MNLVIKYSVVKYQCDTIAQLIPKFQEQYKDMIIGEQLWKTIS